MMLRIYACFDGQNTQYSDIPTRQRSGRLSLPLMEQDASPSVKFPQTY